MRANIGNTDRVVRLLLAFFIGWLSLIRYVGDMVSVLMTILAVYLFLTNFTGFCPIYRLFGVKPQRRKVSFR